MYVTRVLKQIFKISKTDCLINLFNIPVIFLLTKRVHSPACSPTNRYIQIVLLLSRYFEMIDFLSNLNATNAALKRKLTNYIDVYTIDDAPRQP